MSIMVINASCNQIIHRYIEYLREFIEVFYGDARVSFFDEADETCGYPYEFRSSFYGEFVGGSKFFKSSSYFRPV